MIVVAIIGILASIAIPAYQDYNLKAKYAEIVSATQSVRTAVSMCLQENAGNATSCDTAAELGINLPTPKYATGAITLTAGSAAINATGNAAAGGFSYIITPNLAAGNTVVGWSQTGTCEAAKVCPQE